MTPPREPNKRKPVELAWEYFKQKFPRLAAEKDEDGNPYYILERSDTQQAFIAGYEAREELQKLLDETEDGRIVAAIVEAQKSHEPDWKSIAGELVKGIRVLATMCEAANLIMGHEAAKEILAKYEAMKK